MSGFGNVAMALPTGPSEPELVSILFAVADARANPLYSIAMRSFDGGDTWEDVPAFPTHTMGWECMAYSDTLDCIVATSRATVNDNIAVSFDRGVSWQVIDKGNNLDLFRVVWVPWTQQFIAPCGFIDFSGTYVFVSSDGLNWTLQTISPNDFFSQTINMMVPVSEVEVVYGNIGNRDTNSPNGLTLWAPPRFTVGTLRREPAGYLEHNYSPSLNRFVMAGTADGTFWYTDMISNAINTGVIAGAGSSNQPVVWSPTLGYFLSTASENNKVSPDGINWTDEDEPVNTIAYYATTWSTVFERFVSVGRVNAVGKSSYSATGLQGTWTIVPAVSDANWVFVKEFLAYD